MLTFLKSFFNFSRSFLSSSSSSASESARVNEPFALLDSSESVTVRTLSSASASTSSTASAINVSTSSSSTSSSSTSSPSMLTMADLPALPATGATGFVSTNAYSAFFKIREGLPSPALWSFSVITGISMANARASSTKSLSAFLGIRLIDVTPRLSSSAKISALRVTACLASMIA